MKREREVVYHEHLIKLINGMRLHLCDLARTEIQGNSRTYYLDCDDESVTEAELHTHLECVLKQENIPNIVDIRLFQVLYINLFKINRAEAAINLFELVRGKLGVINSDDFHENSLVKKLIVDEFGEEIVGEGGHDSISLNMAILSRDMDMTRVEFDKIDVEKILVSIANSNLENIDYLMDDLFRQTSELMIEGLKSGFLSHGVIFITSFLYGMDFNYYLKEFSSKFEDDTVTLKPYVYFDYPFQGVERGMNIDERRGYFSNRCDSFVSNASEAYKNRTMSRELIEALILVNLKGWAEFVSLRSEGILTVPEAQNLLLRLKEFDVFSDAVSAVDYIIDLMARNGGYPSNHFERGVMGIEESVSSGLLSEKYVKAIYSTIFNGTYAVSWKPFDPYDHSSLFDLSQCENLSAYKTNRKMLPARMAYSIIGIDKINRRNNKSMLKAIFTTLPINHDSDIINYYLDRFYEDLICVLNDCFLAFKASREVSAGDGGDLIKAFRAAIDNIKLFRREYQRVMHIEASREMIGGVLGSQLRSCESESLIEKFGVSLDSVVRFENKLPEIESKRKAVVDRLKRLLESCEYGDVMRANPIVYKSTLSLAHYAISQFFEIEIACENLLRSEYLVDVFERDKRSNGMDDYNNMCTL